MERLAYLTTGDRIEAEELAFILSPSAGGSSLIAAGRDLNDATHEFQRKYIQQAIDAARGNVSQAAKTLGVHRSNLYRKMRQLGMETDEERGRLIRHQPKMLNERRRKQFASGVSRTVCTKLSYVTARCGRRIPDKRRPGPTSRHGPTPDETACSRSACRGSKTPVADAVG